MQDTESYLNQILQKRLGSVPNYGGISKNGGTVTRLAQKEQKLQNMPTVFRNKHETVYRASQAMQSQEFRSSVLPQKQDSEYLPKKRQSNSKTKDQRVQYMVVSKRIESKQQQVQSPSIDISKYRQSQYIPPEHVENTSSVINRNTINQMQTTEKRLSTSSSQNSSKAPYRMTSQQNKNDFQVIHEEFEPQQSHPMSRPPLAKNPPRKQQPSSPIKRKRIFSRSIEKK